MGYLTHDLISPVTRAAADISNENIPIRGNKVAAKNRKK
jgi:hypothetical protein